MFRRVALIGIIIAAGLILVLLLTTGRRGPTPPPQPPPSAIATTSQEVVEGWQLPLRKADTGREFGLITTKQAVVHKDSTVDVTAPLITLTKGEIIRLGLSLGVDFSLTHSCYDPDPRGRGCGRCDSCRLRLKGFAEAGLRDPIEYADACD